MLRRGGSGATVARVAAVGGWMGVGAGGRAHGLSWSGSRVGPHSTGAEGAKAGQRTSLRGCGRVAAGRSERRCVVVVAAAAAASAAVVVMTAMHSLPRWAVALIEEDLRP